MFNIEGGGDASSILSDGKVYVVLEQVGKEDKENLSFGLKVVNKDGKEIGKGTKALLVTEKSVGLLSIQAWYEFLDRTFEVNETSKEILRGLQVRPIFDAKANNIDAWLNDIRTTTGSSLSNTVIWKTSSPTKFRGLNINVGARWQSWCGKTSGSGKGKKLDFGKDAGSSIGGSYKKADTDVDLKIGSVPSSKQDNVWALVPIGKPIMRIKLSKDNMNDETIQGTLEPMNDSYKNILI